MNVTAIRHRAWAVTILALGLLLLLTFIKSFAPDTRGLTRLFHDQRPTLEHLVGMLQQDGNVTWMSAQRSADNLRTAYGSLSQERIDEYRRVLTRAKINEVSYDKATSSVMIYVQRPWYSPRPELDLIYGANIRGPQLRRVFSPDGPCQQWIELERPWYIAMNRCRGTFYAL